MNEAAVDRQFEDVWSAINKLRDLQANMAVEVREIGTLQRGLVTSLTALQLALDGLRADIKNEVLPLCQRMPVQCESRLERLRALEGRDEEHARQLEALAGRIAEQERQQCRHLGWREAALFAWPLVLWALNKYAGGQP